MEAVRQSPLGGFRRFSAQRPITTFLLIVFGLGWPVLAILALASHGVIADPGIPVPAYVLVVNGLIMLPAALWVTAQAEGTAAMRTLLARAFRWRFKLIWYAVIVLALPAIALGVGLLLGGSLKPFDPGVLPGLIGSLLSAVLIIHIWEETVWGGFLQTRLERRHTLLVAAALSAIPFAGVHVPLIFVDEFTVGSALRDIAGLYALAFAVRLMFGVVMRNTNDSVLAIGLMHGIFNKTNNRGGLNDSLLSGVDIEWCALAAVVIVTAIAAAAARHRLTRAYRADLEARMTKA